MQYKIALFFGLSVISVGGAYALSVAHSIQDTDANKLTVPQLAISTDALKSQSTPAQKRPVTVAEASSGTVTSSMRPPKRPEHIAMPKVKDRAVIAPQISTKSVLARTSSQRPLARVLIPNGQLHTKLNDTGFYDPVISSIQADRSKDLTGKPWVIGAFR